MKMMASITTISIFLILSTTILFSLFAEEMQVRADAGGKNRKDDDCSKDGGQCGWTFQDAFCSHAHAPEKISNNNSHFFAHDLRYRIHAFGVAHGTLYIFAAGAFFAVPLGHPPFNASYGLSPFDLSNQLPNNFYRAYRILNYNYATLVLELDQDWELFIVGSNLQDIPRCCSQIWHTQQVIRNRRHEDARGGHYEAPPGVFVFGFNAFFGDNATEMNGTVQYAIDRVISGERFFFHVRSYLSPADGRTRLYTISRYEQEKGPLAFRHAQYVIYPQEACSFANTTKSWFLERKDRLTDEKINELLPITTNFLAARFPIVMLKNGYIYEDTMYLSKLDYLEVYKLSYPEGKGAEVNGTVELVPKILVTFTGNITSENTVYCRLLNEDNTQYLATMQLGVGFLLATLLLAVMIFVNKVNSGASRKYLNSGGHLIRLTSAMVYQAAEKAEKAEKASKKEKTSKKE